MNRDERRPRFTVESNFPGITVAMAERTRWSRRWYVPNWLWKRLPFELATKPIFSKAEILPD